MVYNNDKLTNLDDDFHDLPYLEYDEVNIYHEWYLLEGEQRISELSRQLRTFFNYKQSYQIYWMENGVVNALMSIRLFFQ